MCISSECRDFLRQYGNTRFLCCVYKIDKAAYTSQKTLQFVCNILKMGVIEGPKYLARSKCNIFFLK